MSADLIEKMRNQRKSWCDLPGGKRLQIIRPPEVELWQFRAGGLNVDVVAKYVCGWSGFVESDLLGSGVGGSHEVAYSPDLCKELLADRLDLMQAAADALVAAISAHLEAKASAEKNSLPS